MEEGKYINEKVDKILDTIIESKFMDALVVFAKEHPTLCPITVSAITYLFLWFLPKIFFKILT